MLQVKRSPTASGGKFVGVSVVTVIVVVATRNACAVTRSDTHRLAEGLWRLFLFASMTCHGLVPGIVTGRLARLDETRCVKFGRDWAIQLGSPSGLDCHLRDACGCFYTL